MGDRGEHPERYIDLYINSLRRLGVPVHSKIFNSSTERGPQGFQPVGDVVQVVEQVGGAVQGHGGGMSPRPHVRARDSTDFPSGTWQPIGAD